MGTTPISVIPAAAATTPTSGSALPSAPSLNNMFLQLLVAQLQNQNPLTPLDPSQFVGQLAQFSELSTVTSIYQLLQQMAPAGSGSGSSGGTPPASGNSNNTSASPVAAAASSILPSAAAPASAASKFVSPVLSALTSKIQGAF